MTITPKTIQDVIDDISAGLAVSKISKKNNVSNGTYYRIKNGGYDQVLATQSDNLKN